MKGTITSFRRGKRVTSHNQMIILVEGIDNKDKAKEIVGKTVVWKSPAGKELKGKVSFPHGNKGCIRAIFETGMPGQSLGSKVEIK